MKLFLALLLFVPIATFSQSLEQLSAKPKPSPTWQTTEDWCKKEGDSDDPELSVVKNRIDIPKSTKKYYSVKFEEIRDLSYKKGSSGDRKGKNLNSVYKYEGMPIRLQGYLLYTKDSQSNKMVGGIQEGEEACNCHKDEFEHVDYHLWLVQTPGDPMSKAVVVEMTPRVRNIKKGRWTNEQSLETDLNFLASQKISVRVYGWLLFDGEHVNQLPKPGKDPKKIRRGTLWEIHPITRVDSFQNGKWKEWR